MRAHDLSLRFPYPRSRLCVTGIGDFFVEGCGKESGLDSLASNGNRNHIATAVREPRPFEKAPPFVVLERWEQRTSPYPFIRCRRAGPRYYRRWRPPFEHREGWGSLSRGCANCKNTRVGQPPSLSSEAKGSGQGGSGTQVSRTTLLDAAHASGVSRDRSHREQLGVAPGRRKLDRRC